MDQPTQSRARAVERSAYGILHKYLRDRYAHIVVLTFSQIEDLLGTPLPEGARAGSTWWADVDAEGTPSPQADAWIQAKRTAVPNLAARTLRFERVSV